MNRYRRWLLFFGGLFLLSAGLLLVSLLLASGLLPPGNTPSGQGPDGAADAFSLTLVLPALTAVGSAIGFAVTTVFRLRDDRRDSERHTLEMERLHQELKLKELEIEELKRKQGGSA